MWDKIAWAIIFIIIGLWIQRQLLIIHNRIDKLSDKIDNKMDNQDSFNDLS